MHNMYVGPPSSPTSLVITPLDGTSDGRHVVRLEWSPPLDDGGAAVTRYEIFVDDMILIVTTATTRVDLTLTSGEPFMGIRALNCAGYSANISSNFTAAILLSTLYIVQIPVPFLMVYYIIIVPTTQQMLWKLTNRIMGGGGGNVVYAEVLHNYTLNN